MAKKPAKPHHPPVSTTLYRDLADAYHRGDGSTVGRLLSKVRASARARERARKEESVRPLHHPEKYTAQFPPPPRTVRGGTTSRLAQATSRRLRKYKRLLRDGAIIPGVVTAVSVSFDNRRRTVTYAYRPPFAPTYTGRTIGRNMPRPAIGETVMVFYDARRPADSVAYEVCGFEVGAKATPQ